MKILLLLLSLFACVPSMAQITVLSGKVLHSRAGDSVEVNFMPFGSQYFKDYSIYTTADVKGTFQLPIQTDGEKFILLRYHSKEEWLLISPGRQLFVNVDTTCEGVFTVSGAGAPENKLLKTLRPKELYFLKDVDWGNGTNEYMKLPEDSFKTVVWKMVLNSIDSSLKMIDRANLPIAIKKALRIEVRYYYFPQFAQLAWNGWHFRHLRISGYFGFMDKALSAFGSPSLEDIKSGSPSAFDYMSECYWGINRLKANFGYGYDKSKVNADKEFERIYKYNSKENRRVSDSIGYIYADALAAQRFLPPYAFEKWLALNVEFWTNEGDLLNSTRLKDDLVRLFPKNCYIRMFRKKIEALQREKDNHIENRFIKFRKKSQNFDSVEQLVEPYKGKVVYLDFWGTWCGWCIDEIRRAAPALRERMKGKDVVFLYVACDNDSDSLKWKNDIYIYNMEGDHIRIPKNEISAVRDELDRGEAEKRASLYPTYYIFDRQGNPVIKNAKRPSDGESLYRQIDSVLGLSNDMPFPDWGLDQEWSCEQFLKFAPFREWQKITFATKVGTN